MKSTVSLKSDQLNKEDLRALLQAIRDCEMSNFPNKEIRIWLDVPELSVDECRAILTGIKPPYGYGPFTFDIK